jgi:hypothetical protein
VLEEAPIVDDRTRSVGPVPIQSVERARWTSEGILDPRGGLVGQPRRDDGAAVVTVVIWTAGEIVFLPTLSAYVSDLAPRGRAGEYMGYYLMAFGIAFALAPWLGTEVMQRFGSKTLWLASLAFGLISAFLLLRIAGAEAAKRIAGGTHLGAPAE